MKVLSISTDIKIFEDGSSVLERQKEYASRVKELHIVVFTNTGFVEKQIGNLYLYPTNSKILSFFLGWLTIRKILKKQEGFVITTQDPFETGLLGVFIKYFYKLPLQIQIHTDFIDPYFKNSILNRIRVILANYVIPCADGARVVSSTISDSLTFKYPNLKAKVDVLPIWVDVGSVIQRSRDLDTNQIEKDAKIPTPTILMYSRFSEEKRLDLALRVFKNISNSIPQARMIMAGDGDLKNKIIEMRNRIGLKDKVDIQNWLVDPMQIFFKTADIFLLTSDFEGYGMTLVEAAASGCPIVTTRVGLAKTDLFKDGVNSYVCPVGDVKCLSEKLSDLVSNPGKAREFASRMKTDIQKLSISKEDYVTKYVGLLESLLNK